ncbi:GatB/YqeY domain-containing protein [Fluviibacterium sp. DFM31]|uniref:GatB/YqeY domain-containing protein n=1 Tax=Meridianimarinicoccus marinus TaxID=3231483 RepID=A0ABV3L5R2_9RHOB
MDLKTKVSSQLKQAMKDKDTRRLSTLRLINAAIKDLEIAKRNCEEGDDAALGNDEVLGILTKMVKQRRESERAYEEGGRLELAEQEREEAEIIAEFLPKPLSDAEKEQAIKDAIADSGAGSLRDMGKVMSLLKQRHAGRLDFATVGPEVRERLAS